VIASDIKVAAGVTSLASGDGALWVSGFGEVSRLDPTSSRLIAAIRTPGSDGHSQIAVGERAVWVTSTARGVVYRIDPVAGRVTATIDLDAPAAGIAVGGGRVWVVLDLPGPGRLIAIDPRINRVIGRPIIVGPGPGLVVYGEHAVWVQNTSPASVMRINPASGQVKTVVDTGRTSPGSPGPGAIAVGYGSLWSLANGTLTRLGPGSGHAIASIAVPRGVAIALGQREVWVVSYPRSSSATLFEPIRHTADLREIDPHNNRIIGKPIQLNALQPIAITTTHNNLWVANFSSTITRFRLLACHAHSHRARRALA
jgi:streptogramin lyase